MKKVLSLLLVIVLMFAFNTGASADEAICVTLDGNYVGFDVEPQVIDGRIMVPIRAIFEAMGAQVTWDNATSTAVCTKGDTVVKMTVGSKEMYIGSELLTMDVSPAVIDGRTLAPARYVAEAFGANVQWNQDANTVVITSTYPAEESRTLFAMDGRTLSVPKSQVQEYLNVGWYENYEDTVQTLYAADGRTVSVYKAEVPSYLAVGWYAGYEETRQTLYAADGRTVTVYKAEVPSYLAVGWYETSYEAKAAAEAAARASYSSSSSSSSSGSSSSAYNPGSDGYYYRTPSGKKYHLDPNCGGKNSYRTSNISGLSPCAKCAQ